jgi:sugar/nucleoside kinase (ribokinase family)
VLYTGRCAAALGAEVTLLTRVPSGFDHTAFGDVTVIALPATSAPRYVNRYDDTGARTQLLIESGEPLPAAMITAHLPASPDVLVLAPAFHELDALPATAARVVAVELQGLLRTTDANDRVIPRRPAWEAVAPFIQAGVLAFSSIEDTPDAEALGRRIARAGGIALVTHGAAGATCFHAGGEETRPSPPARMIDPTGAGDCFAAAFVVRYAESDDLSEAFSFALAAGALAVEGAGLRGIPSRAAVEARLAQVAA